MESQEPALQFERIAEADIPILTAIMTRAFDNDAQTYLGQAKGGPPGYDTGDFLRKWAFEEGGLGWKIIAAGKLVGAFIVFTNPEKDYWLGNIFVDPDHQNQQIGTRTWEFIETNYSDAKAWNLETPAWAVRNHHFYEKQGFVRVRVAGDDVSYRKECARK